MFNHFNNLTAGIRAEMTEMMGTPRGVNEMEAQQGIAGSSSSGSGAGGGGGGGGGNGGGVGGAAARAVDSFRANVAGLLQGGGGERSGEGQQQQLSVQVDWGRLTELRGLPVPTAAGKIVALGGWVELI